MAKDEINAFLGSGTTYQGNLNFQGSVRIDGMFTGEIKSEGTLIVGKDARVEGDLAVGQLVLSGHVEGNIAATKKVVLHKTANLVGSLTTPVLVIEEGAKVEGQLTMHTETGGESRKNGKSSSGGSSFSSMFGKKQDKPAGKTLDLGGSDISSEAPKEEA